MSETIRASAMLTLADLSGPATRLGPDDFAAAARRLGVGVAKVEAVDEVESTGRGFGDGGRPIILFEPHVFSALTSGAFDASHPDVSYRRLFEKPYPSSQQTRYAQLAQAMGLNPEAALKATSWGLYQILGKYHALAGFPDVFAFVRDMVSGESAQLAAFAQFLLSQPPILSALRLGDWAGFARHYNGPAYAQHGYDQRLKVAFRRRVAADPPSAPAAAVAAA